MTSRYSFSGADATLYMPCYNPGSSLKECLDGIRALSVAPSRIIVVDDGSESPLQSDEVEIIRHPHNRGLAAARNTALDACRSSLIAALDADVVPSPDWLEKLIEEINTGDWAGVGGRLTERHTDAVADRWRAVHMAQHWGNKPVAAPRFLYGSNTLFKADLLRSVGGYDARLRTNNEDRTISEALYSRGHNLFYQPDARCEHLRRDTEKSVLRSYWQWHHAKGLVEGDFDSIEGVISRIDRVNFGIADYCYKTDCLAQNLDLIHLDLLIPWVFCFLDLELYAQRMNQSGPMFRITDDLIEGMPESMHRLLVSIISEDAAVSRQEPVSGYSEEFRRTLVSTGWPSRLKEYAQ